MNRRSRLRAVTFTVSILLCLFAYQEAFGQTALTNSLTVTNISQSQGNWRDFYIDVPAGMQTLTIQTWGGTGDADLYVRRNAIPFLATYDYRSINWGNTETITIYNPVSARYYIGLYAYSAYSGVSLRATYVATLTALTNGVAVTNIGGAQNSWRDFYIDVPAGTSSLTIQTWGGTGDADLYVRRGGWPTTTTYDYRSQNWNSTESITINYPTSGRYYISLYGYTAYSGVSLRATYVAAPIITPLTNGVPVSNLSGATGSMRYYSIYVPPGQSSLTVQTGGGGGDVDLYVRYGASPTTTSYTARSWASGNTENITISNPTSGTWYIGLHAYSAYSGVSLRATYVAAITALSNGVARTSLSGSTGSMTYYYIDVPSGQASLTVQTWGGGGDADLYVRYGASPTTTSYTARSWASGNTENITINNPTSGRWYIGLHAYSAYSGLNLLATYAPPTTVITLSNGVTVTGISGATNSVRYYRISVPSGQSTLTVQIWGGLGDCDLYVKRGSIPTLSSWDYRPYLTGNNETVTVNNPLAGDWYIMLHGWSSYSGVSLRATYAYASITPLTNGVTVTNIFGSQTYWRDFYIDVPTGRTSLTIQTWGGTGDADLYVRRGGLPTTTTWDYRSWNWGNNESITINFPTSGRYYIGLYGFQAFSGVSLRATYY
jgi:hypothetical protein